MKIPENRGLVNNLNDALAWGLAPLYLAAHGASVREIAVVAAASPAVWGAGQLLTGWLSDHIGRKPLITAGMLLQAGALGVLIVATLTAASGLVVALTAWQARNGLRAVALGQGD